MSAGKDCPAKFLSESVKSLFDYDKAHSLLQIDTVVKGFLRALH